MYILTEDLNQPGIMTDAQIIELKNFGFEIASHSVSHPHLTLLNTTQLDSELKNSQIMLQNKFNVPVSNFASPYGEYNDEVIQYIKKYYKSHRSVDVGFNAKNNFDIYNIKVKNVNSNVPASTVLEWVDEAKASKTWLVLVYHDILVGGDFFTSTPQNLDTVLAGLKKRNMNVKTVEGALQEILPQL
jgi:peptidoglycan/xylan/chitin deacetylase (PgdA/CDA1 family)